MPIRYLSLESEADAEVDKNQANENHSTDKKMVLDCSLPGTLAALTVTLSDWLFRPFFDEITDIQVFGFFFQ